MKNQDKILEVLSEILKVQYRKTEILSKQGDTLERNSALLEKLVEGQHQLIESQITTNAKLVSVDDRLGSLEYKSGVE